MPCTTDEQLKDFKDGKIDKTLDPIEVVKKLAREGLAMRKLARALMDCVIEDEEPEEIEKKDHMIYLNGSKSSFHCEARSDYDPNSQCGCNVFRHPVGKSDVYICNACEARYNGA